MLRTYYLNVGLYASDNFNTGVTPTAQKLCSYLEAIDLRVWLYKVKPSDTELTFVAMIKSNLPYRTIKARIEDMATLYKQDCIAINDEYNNGELIGLYADKWGEFDVKHFVRLNDD